MVTMITDIAEKTQREKSEREKDVDKVGYSARHDRPDGILRALGSPHNYTWFYSRPINNI